LGEKVLEGVFLEEDIIFLGVVGDKGKKAGVGIESLTKKTGLLLEAGKIVEILGDGRFEINSLGEVGKGAIGVTLTGVKRG